MTNTAQEHSSRSADTKADQHHSMSPFASQAASIFVADRVAQAGRSTTEAAKLAHRAGGPTVAELAQRMTTQRDAATTTRGDHMRGTRIG